MVYKKIDEIVEIYDSLHKTPKTYAESGYPMVRVKDIEKGFLNLENVAYVDEITYREFTKKYVPQKQDVILSRVGSYGIPCLVQTNDLFCLGQNTVILHPKQVNPYYLYYCMSSNIVQRQIEKLVTGSTQKTISLKSIKEIEIPFPSLPMQKKIGQFFFNLDDKLHTNTQIIRLLEDLATTLFKRWFVDFEFQNEQGKPYKSSGGEIVDSPLGEIPSSWKIGSIEDIGSVVGGGTPSKKYDEYYTPNGISWITPKDLSSNKDIYIYKGATDITELGLRKGSAKLLPKNTVLFSSRAPIGYIRIAGQEVTTNQGFKSIVPDKGFNSYYIYYLLHEKLPNIEAAAGGSTFKEISGKGLKEISIIIPPIIITEEFKEIVEPLFLQIQSLEKENQQFKELRDSLLPKLLSGEVEIPDELVVK